MPEIVEGFKVVTQACETHVSVTVTELPGNNRYTDDLEKEMRRRNKVFLKFWRGLEAYVRSMHIEERLGVPVVYSLPEEYCSSFD